MQIICAHGRASKKRMRQERHTCAQLVLHTKLERTTTHATQSGAKKQKQKRLAVWCEVLRCRVPFSTHEPRPTVTKSAPLQPTAAWIAPSASPPICSSQQLASTVPGLQHASAASSVDRGSTCVVAICARVPRPAADKHTALASIIPAHDKRIGKRFGSDGRWAMLIKRGQRPLVEAI
jgi:hypothetical protein